MFKKHDRVHPDLEGPTNVQQSAAAECDINNLMQRYERNELVDHVNNNPGGYGNFIGYGDYHSSMVEVIKAKEMFMEIPAGVRAVFHNDPGEFLQFVQDPDNMEEMRAMGLAMPSEDAPTGDPEPSPVPEVPPDPPSS